MLIYVFQMTGNNAFVSPQLPTNSPQMVQRVQTIQLPSQKQKMLTNIQSQIQAILARKTNTQAEQATLTKLYQEHARIVATGKVVSSTTHPVNSSGEIIGVSSAQPIFTSPPPIVKNTTISGPIQMQMQMQAQTQTPLASFPVVVSSSPTMTNTSYITGAIQQALPVSCDLSFKYT